MKNEACAHKNKSKEEQGVREKTAKQRLACERLRLCRKNL